MDTLPVELVDIILGDAGALMWPVLGRVCREWHDLAQRRRPKKRFHENRRYKRCHFTPKWYKHRCTSPALCAIFYMTRLIDAGHWHLLDWMIEMRPCTSYKTKENEYTQRYVCAQLASHGDTARLCTLRDTHEFQWDADTMSCAARYGHLDMVKWLSPELWSDRQMSAGAARGGHLSILQWTLELRMDWSTAVCAAAARGGHLKVLQWLRANRCPWDASTATGAAKNGHLHVLEWAVANGCLLDDTAIDMAAKGGHLAIVKWLSTNNCPWNMWTCSSALQGDHIPIAEWLHAQGRSLVYAAQYVNNVHTLEWLRDKGYVFDKDALWHALQTKCPNAIKWLIGRGIEPDAFATNALAKTGDFDILRLMHAHALAFPSAAASYAAAKRGRIDTLQWLHDNGWPLDPNLCRAASQQCHLHILKWARTHGSKWDETVCVNAAENGDLEMLQWARANDCPWNEKVCRKAAEGGHLDVLQWAVDNGCTLDKMAHKSALYRLYDHVAVWLDARQNLHHPQ